jgi:hypothetical protein
MSGRTGHECKTGNAGEQSPLHLDPLFRVLKLPRIQHGKSAKSVKGMRQVRVVIERQCVEGSF